MIPPTRTAGLQARSSLYRGHPARALPKRVGLPARSSSMPLPVSGASTQ